MNPYEIIDEHINWLEQQPKSPERDRLLSLVVFLGMAPAVVNEIQDDCARYRHLRCAVPGCDFAVAFKGEQVMGKDLDRLLDEERNDSSSTKAE